jgi:hypothetical protein
MTTVSKMVRSIIEAKKNYIRGKPLFWTSKDAPIQLDSTFEKLMKYVDSHIKKIAFQKVLEALGACIGRKILDFSAGHCWASHAFSMIGYDTVVVDFDASDVSGLATK